MADVFKRTRYFADDGTVSDKPIKPGPCSMCGSPRTRYEWLNVTAFETPPGVTDYMPGLAECLSCHGLPPD